MEQSEFNFEYFFDLTADLLCIAGYDGYFKKVNPAVSQVLGYTMEELYVTPINDFVHPEDRNTTSQVRDQLHKAKPLLNFENRYVTKSGETVWLSWTSMPVDNQKVVFAIAKNITHQKEIEGKRNSMLSQLSLLNQELKQLTFSTSHDLRAPVNSLVAAFDHLDTDKIEDEETLELIQLLRNTGKKLSVTLNNYVDILKERHEKEASIEQIHLSDTIHGVLESIKSLIESSKTRITIDFSKVDLVQFNVTYLESIFLNLITNSIGYAKPGIAPEINIWSQHHNGQPQLIIQDNGMGMDLEKIGHRIFRINQSFHGNPDSKGVGLYLIYHHVTTLGGRIEVESQVNEGTRFSITFP
jgi:PAS domain S-box-containing protein